MSLNETADTAGKAPVIQLIRGAELTGGERVLHRILPACVASAGGHLLLAGGVGLFAWLFPTAEAKSAAEEVAVAIEEKADQPTADNLTDTTPALDDSIAPTSIDTTDRLDKVTVQAELTTPDPVGNDGPVNAQVDSVLAVGLDNPNLMNVGLDATGPGAGALGAGNPNGLANIANPSLVGRSAATRDELLKIYGGNKESQLAVAKGLAWLAQQQKKDGSWEFDGSSKDKTAATGLALLPFLAAGETHKVVKGNKYRETVAAGLNYLLEQQRKSASGGFTDQSYAHGIATVAVCEAFGMTSDRALLMRPAQAAIDHIQKGQGANGSWGYSLGGPNEGDTSIVGWQVQALHSAKLCKDLKVNQRTLDKAMKFLDTVASGSSKSKFGYSDAKSATATRTSIGLLCRYYLNGWGPNHVGLKDGVDYLMKQQMPEASQTFDMYYYYYATQVLHFHEGDAWHKEWNPKMRDLLTGKQVKEPNKPAVDGSWDADKGSWIGPQCGRLGTTCMALLTLEVYYRHLPLYGRGTGGRTDLEGK